MTKLEFKISTGLKNIIGRELITDDNIAIFELVKNAYDANAKKVRIIFQNLKEPTTQKPSKIWIVDDGDGMSYEEINDKWLFVGYSAKKEVREDYRDKIKKPSRFLAGYKGIGRFSADRLGSRLNLYTKKESEKDTHTVKMDWGKFEEDQTKEFETIEVDYATESNIDVSDWPATNLKKGTILEIFPLRDHWDSTKLLNLKRYLQRLINPSQDPENQDFKIELIANEFEEEDRQAISEAKKKEVTPQIINGSVRNVVFERLNIKTTQIICNVNNGEIISELIDKGVFIFRLKEKLPQRYSKLNDISLRIFFLNEDAKAAFSKMMGLQPVRYGSIFLYKNGFRIHPYGDEDDDWLGLESRKTQGYKRYLSAREVMGRIELYGDQSGFNEVSSRSGGVIKSADYEQLRDFYVEKVHRKLERYVVEGIYWDSPLDDEGTKKSEDEIRKDSVNLISKLVGRDETATIEVNKDLFKILKEKQHESIPQLIKNFEVLLKHMKSPSQKTYLKKQVKSMRVVTKTFSSLNKQKDKRIEELQKESVFLKKAVSEKEQLENLYHSINISSQLIEASISEINDEAKKDQKIEKILPLIDEISIENQKIKTLYYVAKYARFEMKIDNQQQDLVAYIREYIQMIFKRRSLKLGHILENENIVFKTKFVPLEISIILDNLISNSSKAGAKSISFKFQKNENGLRLLVGDSGEGVSKKVEDRIFERGISTTRGSGIGLHHVKTIMNSHRSNIKFIGNNVKGMGRGACFELLFR